MRSRKNLGHYDLPLGCMTYFYASKCALKKFLSAFSSIYCMQATEALVVAICCLRHVMNNIKCTHCSTTMCL